MGAQPALAFTPTSTRPTLCDRLAAFLEAHPNVWIDGMELAKIAGQYAWRSRVSDLRKRGMVLENRIRIVTRADRSRYAISEYRLVQS